MAGRALVGSVRVVIPRFAFCVARPAVADVLKQAKGRKVAEGVVAMVVPGSGMVKEQAEVQTAHALCPCSA